MFTVNAKQKLFIKLAVIISKHFMFTVNKNTTRHIQARLKFQNISCLRLILFIEKFDTETLTFQNISCLRLIKKRNVFNLLYSKFQNISCLRLIFFK